MKYMVYSSELREFFNDFTDAVIASLKMANHFVDYGQETVKIQDIDNNLLILMLYVDNGEVCPFFKCDTSRRNEYFPDCEFDRELGPVSYLENKYGVNRKFVNKYIALKDGKVVAVSSDNYEIEGELKLGRIDLPVQIMHICMDGTVENYEYNGDKE